MKYRIFYENKVFFYDNYLNEKDGRWFTEKLKFFLDEKLKTDVQIMTDFLIRTNYNLTENQINLLEDNYGLYLESIDSIDVNELLKLLLDNEEHDAMNLILEKFIL